MYFIELPRGIFASSFDEDEALARRETKSSAVQ